MDILQILIQTLDMQINIASANHVTDRDAYRDWETCQSTCSKISKTLVNSNTRFEQNPYLYADTIDALDKLKLMIGGKMYELKKRMDNL